jgi:hypothetical protein
VVSSETCENKWRARLESPWKQQGHPLKFCYVLQHWDLGRDSRSR